MTDFIKEIIYEIEEENERLDREFQDIAESCCEAAYEAIPKELLEPYNHKAATEFKKSYYQSCLETLCKGRLIIDLASIVVNKILGRRKNKAITIVYENSLQAGLFEKALADIYCRKIKSGSIEF